MTNGKGELECCYCKYWCSNSGLRGFEAADETSQCTFHQREIPAPADKDINRICLNFSPNEYFKIDNQIERLKRLEQTVAVSLMMEEKFAAFGIELESNILYGFNITEPADIKKLMDLPRLMKQPGKGKSRIMYIELKSGYGDKGPARIGRVSFSKSGRTIYYRGKAFRMSQGISGNYHDIDTGEEYWISGPKKNGQDRHWAGSGKVEIDDDVREEYLQLIGEK